MECGAYDGQTMSNSLYMERTLKWTGVLAEPSPPFYQQLELRNRKAWTMPVCLSLEPYPTVVQYKTFQLYFSLTIHCQIQFWVKVSFQLVRGFNSLAAHIVEANSSDKLWTQPDVELTPVQCFPLYSILLAVNRTRVDFFSLDV